MDQDKRRASRLAKGVQECSQTPLCKSNPRSVSRENLGTLTALICSLNGYHDTGQGNVQGVASFYISRIYRGLDA